MKGKLSQKRNQTTNGIGNHSVVSTQVKGISPRNWRFELPNWLGYYSLVCAVVALLGWFLKRSTHTHITAVVDLLLGLGGLQPTPTLISAVMFLFLAVLCFLRKKIAAYIIIILQILGVMASVFDVSRVSNLADQDKLYLLSQSLGIVGSVFLLVLLFKALPVFVGKIKLVGLFRGLGFFLIGQTTIMLVAFFTINFTPIRSYLDPSISLLTWIFHQLIGIPYEFHFLVPDLARYHALKPIGVLIGVASALVALISVLLFFSGRPNSKSSIQEDLKLRSLLATYGEQDSLGYYATRDDRSVVFSPSGKSAISFGMAAGVAMAAGDPIGEKTDWENVIYAWQLHCYANGYIPAVISASAAGARAYRNAGLRVRAMGDEAVIKPGDTDLHASFFKPLISARRRVMRHNIKIKIARQIDIPAEDLELLIKAAQDFRVGDERGFSMALDRLFAPQDSQQLIVYAVDSQKQVQALLSFVPWGKHGVSLNLMRRSRESINGIVEAMVVTLIERAGDLQIKEISLNFAMFREAFVAGEAVDANFLERLQYRIFRLASRFWQLESLYESNARYAPNWKTRYFCLPVYPLDGLTIFAAGVLEGFIPAPRFFRHLSYSQPKALPLYLDEVKKIEQQAQDFSVSYNPPEQVKVRLEKLERLRECGREPYPAGMDLGLTVEEISQKLGVYSARFAKVFIAPIVDLPVESGLTAVDPGVSCMKMHGRLVARRNHGGVVFLDLYGQGQIIQAVLEKAWLSGADWQDLRFLDLGDQIVLRGQLGKSRNGTPSLLIQSWELASKSLRPQPYPRVKLDVTTRSRQRTLTLLNDASALGRIEMRSKALTQVRNTLLKEGFLEVETPILQAIQGGANARPFVTHANSYATDVFLRIAPELYLKRLAVAGMGAIFEMGRSFRNESADLTHNPEFTSLEVYRAGVDYNYMRQLTEKIFKAAAQAVNGAEIVYRPVGEDKKADIIFGGQSYQRYDISQPWPVIPVYQAVSDALGVSVDTDTASDTLKQYCREHQIELPPGVDNGGMITALYDELVEAQTEYPTFYTDFPISTSPLTRKHRSNPALAERWDLVAFGMELGTAYTELTDPVDQRDRFTAQSLAAAAGDPEAMSLDEGFLQDLELGLLPTGGLGIGMDRLVMFLTGSSIRQILAFPFVRPQG